MNLLRKLFKRKHKPPIFHQNVQPVEPHGCIHTSYIISGGIEKSGWCIIADEPSQKTIFIAPDIFIKLTGRYSKFGVGYAVELEEKYSWIPSEWIGIKIRFIWT